MKGRVRKMENKNGNEAVEFDEINLSEDLDDINFDEDGNDLNFDDLGIEDESEGEIGDDDFGDWGEFSEEDNDGDNGNGVDGDSADELEELSTDDDFGDWGEFSEDDSTEQSNNEEEQTDFSNFDDFDDLKEEQSEDIEQDNSNVDWDDNLLEEDDNNELLDETLPIEQDSVEEIEEVIEESPEDDIDYRDGAIADSSELHDDDTYSNNLNDEHSFINSTGGINVQVTDDERENGFELAYIDIEKIAITKRIRNMSSVDSLVQSIKSTGLLEPLVVVGTETEGLYVLLSGYRRIQACARAGKRRIPCIVNTRINTTEIPIIEAMYNHSKSYTIKEQIDYIDYLEKEQGILNPAMIEYLLQMNSGDYTKLKDILNDNDDDIVSKLYEGAYDIATAFKKLEQRRKKESAEEKENKRASKVYDDEAESGADKIEGSGEAVDGEALTEEQIQSLSFNIEDLDDIVENKSLSDMIEEGDNIEGFEPHKQKVGEREYIDPAIKKSVMARDHSTCMCCRRGGEQYADVLDYHHIKPVFMGGEDTVDNGIMLCVTCHRLVHLYSTGDLSIDKVLVDNTPYDELSEEKKLQYMNSEILEDEKTKFKKVIELGSVIRKGIAMMGMNREQYKKEHPNTGIGRRKPGVNAPQEIS